MNEENKNLTPDDNQDQNQENQNVEQPVAAHEIEVVAETETPAEIVEEPVAEVVEAPVPEPEKPAEETEFIFDRKPDHKSEKTGPKEIKPLDDFNWEVIGKKEESYTKSQRKELEELYNRTLSTVQEGEVLDGVVVTFNKREVVVNIGYKSEGVINANEFRYTPDLKIGDTVEVYVENMEDGNGQLLLSHNKAKALRSWERVNKAHDNDEIIKGYIKCRTKGGMIVDVFGIEAFLPGSQIDVKPIRDYDVYVDKVMEFKVVKINNEFKNVVVSHKALIEAELEEQKKVIISKLEKGQVLEGTVKNITSYGVFIDLGGVDGLIHITDLSWGRVNHPEEIVTLDEKINVVILDFDDDKKRIALGLKQLTPHPWDSLDDSIKVGDKVKGKVVVLADYGAFVEISTGVEGLIHVSEMSWSQHLRSANEFMKVGDEVEAVVLTLDRDERKMSLGIKQLYPDPWEKIQERYPIGSKHNSKVRNFTNFGVFVELEEGVDGLVHISDLSWTKKIKHPAEFTGIGAELEVVVLEIDKENRRLSLGHKQVEENPWDVFETIFSVDSVHEGTIVEMNDKGSIISLPYGVEGFATPKHLVKEDGVQAKADEKLDFKVIEFNKDAKKIFVSHSRIHEDEKREKIDEERRAKQKESGAVSRKAKQPADKIEKTTIGDMVDLDGLKKELQMKEKKEKEEAVKIFEEKIEAAKNVEKKSEAAAIVEEIVEAETKKPATKKTAAKKAKAETEAEPKADEKTDDAVSEE